MKRKSTQKGCINAWNLNHPKCLDCGKLDKNRKRWSSGEKPELCYRPTVRLQDAARRACSALNLTLRWCVGDGKTEEAGDHAWTKKSAMGPGFKAAGNCNPHILLKLVASKQSLSCLAHHPYSYMFQAWNITFLKVGQRVINNYSFLGPTCEVFLEEYLCFVEYTKTLNEWWFLMPKKQSEYLAHSMLSLWLLWWLSDKKSTWQCRRCRFNPWIGNMPCRRKRQPAPVFLPGLWQRSLAGYSPWVTKELDMT